MDVNKQRQEVSLIGQILSLEALLFLMGLVSLVYGLFNSEFVNIIIGAGLISGLILLMLRKKKVKK